MLINENNIYDKFVELDTASFKFISKDVINYWFPSHVKECWLQVLLFHAGWK